MCQFSEIQISGENFGANGQPTGLEVFVRVEGCMRVDIKIYTSSTATNPILEALSESVQSGADFILKSFAAPADSDLSCGDMIYVEISCSTDPECLLHRTVMIQCKGFEGSTCPTIGPTLSVEPPIDMQADCIAAGNYTITMGGTWPDGTSFSWKKGALPPGQLSDTGVTSQSFTFNHIAGSGLHLITAGALAPGCTEVESGVIFPPADNADCPTNVTIVISGGGTSQTLNWSVGQEPIILTDLPPGHYTAEITVPAETGIEYQWFRDNIAVALGHGVTELIIGEMNNDDSTSLAIILDKPCCNPVIVNVTVQIKASEPTETPPVIIDPPETVDPPVIVDPPPPWWCVILDIVVALALIAVLVGLVLQACTPILTALFLPGLIVSALIAIGAAILLLLICGPNWCRIFGVISWAMRWAMLIGIVIAISCLSPVALMMIVAMGGMLAGIMWGLIRNGCSIPRLFSIP